MWYYRVCKKYRLVKGKKFPFYCIVEYFPRVPKYRGFHKIKGTVALWSDDPQWPFGSSRKDVILCLEMMLKDAKRYKTLVEKKPYKGDK
jgi:hypothetical protein